MTTSSKHTHLLVRVDGLSGLTKSLGQECTKFYLAEFKDRLKSLLRPRDKLIKVATDKYLMVLRNVFESSHGQKQERQSHRSSLH